MTPPHRLPGIGRRRRGDRGSVSLELAILAPVIFGMLLVIVAAGRVHLAHNVVDAAARNAARAASLERDAASARAAGTRVAQQTFQDQGLTCSGLSVTVPTSGFQAPLGTPSSVTVTVRCTVALADVALPGLPGSTTASGSFTSAIDAYRGRPTA
ncbi:Flp pilus assembly protein TadG [Kitasatospora sp. MAA19]|uniref:TadE/TadG family type IV pilus assembly protein n=1 Tax=Kitasatospora sp. MAA19 TaxID=3035090 RepID=UPI0024742AAF|nr:TadE/TadG family type IV pilus assembly protein [Kitasatospora sp. MAA19]MDH6710908.1 Flp pilus assembly protein TadG [Kitasatospora sp. MAA19]